MKRIFLRPRSLPMIPLVISRDDYFYGKSPTLRVKTQLRIVREAMGIAQWAHDEMAEQNWMNWYLKNARVMRPYRSKVSEICEEYNIDSRFLFELTDDPRLQLIDVPRLSFRHLRV